MLKVLAAAGVAAGCAAPQAHTFTFQHGVHLLASGSPASAIPALSQVIASEPDGPEPHAILAVAYALDGRRDLAVVHAGEARRRRRRDHPPGWEGVALAVVAMREHEPSVAVRQLTEVAAGAPRPSPLAAAADRWLVLAQLQHGDFGAALTSLSRQPTAGTPQSETADPQGGGRATAQERATLDLWAVLTYAYQGEHRAAGEALAEVARRARGRRSPASGPEGSDRSDPSNPSDKSPPARWPSGGHPLSSEPSRYPVASAASTLEPRDLAPAGLDALGRRDLAHARSAFAALHQASPATAEAAVWLALMDGVEGRWDAMREGLSAAADRGSLASRGLAHHLLSVVAALEARPNDLVEHLLAGQRLLSRSHGRLPSPSPAQRERVWMSDRIN